MYITDIEYYSNVHTTDIEYYSNAHMTLDYYSISVIIMCIRILYMHMQQIYNNILMPI